MSKLNLHCLRATLVLASAFAVFSGLDQALGGLRTLGWMGQPSFFQISAHDAFLVADNHQRFLGGVWTGLGLLILLAAAQLEKYEHTLKLVLGLIFLGGLARFSQLDVGVTLGPDILPALLVELVGMPVLFLWISRTVGGANEPPRPAE